MRLTPIEGENRGKVTKKSSHEATSRCYSKYFSPGRIKLPSILNVEEEAADLLDLDGVRELQATGSRHRVPKKYNTPEVSGPSKPPGKKKKTSRPYAPPETYAHLAHIPDYLKDNLDVVFCGINPAVRSSTDGHHYAHPTNHFWKCLTLSKFTGPITPSEDSTLPGRFNLGLTNLIDRPSSEQSELSREEMRDAAPGLIAKIGAYKPLVACFVGKVIWDHVEPCLVQVSQEKVKRPRKQPFSYDLQPYKLVYSEEAPQESVQETLFFVVPSTSARVVRYDLQDKAKMFTLLRSRLDEIKAREVDTIMMTPIHFPIPPLDSATHSGATTPSTSV